MKIGRQAKVANLEMALWGDQEVVRLDISVDVPCLKAREEICASLEQMLHVLEMNETHLVCDKPPNTKPSMKPRQSSEIKTENGIHKELTSAM